MFLLVVSIYALIAAGIGWYLETYHGAVLDRLAALLSESR